MVANYFTSILVLTSPEHGVATIWYVLLFPLVKEVIELMSIPGLWRHWARSQLPKD